MLITNEDGKAADVGNLGVHSYSANYSECTAAARESKMYSVSSTYTTAGAENIIYLQNTDTTNNVNLEIESIVVGSAVNALFTVYEVTGTAGGASAITVANMKIGDASPGLVNATGDASVTGLTLGNKLGQRRIAANDSKKIDLGCNIILPPGKAIAVATGGTGASDATIYFYRAGVN